MKLEQDNDLDGDVISVNGEPTDTTTDDKASTPEDRGDVVTPEAGPTNAEAQEQGDADKAKPNNPIPKARFDEVNEARKSAQSALDAAMAEIAALKAAPAAQAAQAATAADAFDADAKEEAYIEAMMNGETATAKAIRKEINAHLLNQATQQVQANMEQASQRNTMQAESTKALEDYPYLDTQEGALALSLIIAARDADMRAGVPAHLALRKAVAAIAPRFMPDEDAPPSRDLAKGKGSTDTRSTEAVRRGAEDSLRQPAQLQGGIGNRATQARVNVAELDEGQFANLSLAEKKRLRGD